MNWNKELKTLRIGNEKLRPRKVTISTEREDLDEHVIYVEIMYD